MREYLIHENSVSCLSFYIYCHYFFKNENKNIARQLQTFMQLLVLQPSPQGLITPSPVSMCREYKCP